MPAQKLSPIERYEQDLEQRGFSVDSAQREAIEHLQDLYQRLIDAEQVESEGVLSSIKARIWGAPAKDPVKGLYFWGGVGRGKTYLVDIFHDSLPFEQKLRVHFHRFMQQVHAELVSLAGEKNPLEKVADKLAANARVICFDEFFVSDISDAMILGSLFGHLFERGVTLVATSNIIPDGLYKDGLQRPFFACYRFD